MNRPHLIIAVLGTRTEVGKTHVSAALARALRARGFTVGARKPLQSFDPDEVAAGVALDADVLGAATGEAPDVVCRAERSLPVAMAPPMAAEVLGRPCPDTATVVDEITWPAGLDVGIVETVGGTRSPMAADGDSLTVATALRPEISVLVADAALGVLHDVRAASVGLPGAIVVHCNRFDEDDDLHRRNRAWLRHVDEQIVTTAIGDLTAGVVAALELTDGLTD